MAIKALELLLILAGLILTLLMVKGSLMPYSCDIVFSSLVGFWKSCQCFLSSPLYICIIINFMVLFIAASSSLQRHETDNHDRIIDDDPQIKNQNYQPRDVTEVVAPQPMASAKTTLYQGDHSHVVDQICVDERCNKFPFSNEVLVETIETAMEEKKAVKVENSEEEEEDTMEATWRAIMGGGKEKATKKKMKKSGTWNVAPPTMQSHDSEELLQSIPASWKELRKSETFNDAVSVRQRGGLRRDPSVSVDEFNNQVEAFIKKFNESIRLQRQESDQRFIDMINRGL